MSNLDYTIEDVQSAHRKLKSLVYYDKNDLHLRIRLANFEASSLEEKLLVVLDVVNSADPCSHEKFAHWLGSIGSRIVPKSVQNETEQKIEDDGIFISNFLSHKKHNVDKVNYFFDGPIELQIISTLWIIHEGKYLDFMLGDECYGSRLEHESILKDENSPKLFLRYHDLYKKWRDGGIKKARQMLIDEKTSVCILGLDIQEYYYHIDFDYTDATSVINREISTSSEKDRKCKLLSCLEKISRRYRDKIDLELAISHSSNALPIGLPIGLISSPLLANWHLKKFDSEVKDNIRPSYYGRYIDDIFIVIPSPNGFADKPKPVETLIKTILIKNEILNPIEKGKYEIKNSPGLYLQQKKCILQHFDVNHSIAALEKFKKELEANSSDFLLLPVDEDDSSLEDVAYDLLYDGSVNKFRSVKGVAENRYELAKHLARQTILHLLTTDKFDINTRNGLLNFFKGKNAIDFHELWERVFTFFIVSRDKSGFEYFLKNINFEITKIEFQKSEEIQYLLQENLKKHLELSRSIANALDLNVENYDDSKNKSSRRFRNSNLIRHHFIKIPLINYTHFKGSLINYETGNNLSLNSKKIRNSPRFVNFDECMLLVAAGVLKNHSPSEKIEDIVRQAGMIFYKINGRRQSGVEMVKKDVDKDGI